MHIHEAGRVIDVVRPRKRPRHASITDVLHRLLTWRSTHTLRPRDEHAVSTYVYRTGSDVCET